MQVFPVNPQWAEGHSIGFRKILCRTTPVRTRSTSRELFLQITEHEIKCSSCTHAHTPQQGESSSFFLIVSHYAVEWVILLCSWFRTRAYQLKVVISCMALSHYYLLMLWLAHTPPSFDKGRTFASISEPIENMSLEQTFQKRKKTLKDTPVLGFACY